MRDHTPGTGDVRAAYARAMRQAFIASTGEHLEGFDRWLAEHDRQVKAETLRGVASHLWREVDFTGKRELSVPGTTDWLNHQIRHFEKEQTNEH